MPCLYRWKCSNSSNVRVVCGIILLFLPNGLSLYYGNLSIYTDSYFIDKVGVENHECGSMWFMALYSCSVRVALFVSGFSANKYGIRKTLAIACLALNASVFATFFTVQYSFWAMNLTLGAIGGFLSGMVEGMGLLSAAVSFSENASVATSIGCSAEAGGSLIINAFITFYINPRNTAPDVHSGKGSYFSDQDMLSRVPSVFLLLGGLSSVCQAFAFVLLKPPAYSSTPESRNEPDAKFSSQTESVSVKSSDTPSENDNIIGTKSATTPVRTDKNGVESPSNESCTDSVQRNLSTRQILRTCMFYKIVIVSMPISFGRHVVGNFYKQFGMKYIRDDYFLTSVGVAMNVIACVFRLVGGVIVRFIGPQMSYVLLSSVAVIMSIFWYTTPMISKWLFLFCTCTVYAAQNALSVNTTIMTLHYFGRHHYISNYGAILICNSFFILLSPFVVDPALTIIGYFGLFLFVALTCFLSFYVSTTFPPTE